MRRVAAALLTVSLFASPPSHAAEPQAAACPPITGPTGSVVAVEPGPTLRLSDGRTLKLSGVAVPLDAAGAVERRLRALIGKTIRYQESGVDRHGRHVVRVAMVDAPARSLGQALIADGYAVAMPDAMKTPCLAELLSTEAGARESSSGLWGSALRIHQATDSRLEEAVGTLGLIEGRVLSVGKTRTNHYLNFGQSWALDFTVMIPLSDQASWGDDPDWLEQLVGHRVRVRGLLERWNGVLVRVWHPAQIERLDGRD